MTNTPLETYVDDPYLDDYPGVKVCTAKKNMLLSPFGIVVSVTALLMIAVVGWGVYQGSLKQPDSGPAPDFDLPLLGEEGNFKLSDYRGQVVVINFWGSWCIPCREEAPMLQETYELYQDQDVVLVGIAIKDIERDAIAYIDEFNITYPNVMDRGGLLEEAYRIEGVPETFVVNRKGQITEFFYAQPDEADLLAAIEAALDS
ncbi:MAG: TlpA family protein disulfide reductase [Anaerolineae bacterium]|nr:TlpA family protein disulfide reductase [Anaerolineae bacterium]